MRTPAPEFVELIEMLESGVRYDVYVVVDETGMVWGPFEHKTAARAFARHWKQESCYSSTVRELHTYRYWEDI